MAHSVISIIGVFLLIVLQEVQCIESKRDNTEITRDVRDKVLYNPSHLVRNSELIPTIDMKYNGDRLATKGSSRVKRQDPYYNPYYNRYRYPYPIPIFIGGGFGIGGFGGFGGRGFGGRGFGGRGFGGRGFGGRGFGGRGFGGRGFGGRGFGGRGIGGRGGGLGGGRGGGGGRG